MKEPLSKQENNEEAILKITQASTDENNTTVKDINEFDQYEKIYMQHMDEILTLERRQKISKILVLVGLFLFFVMLALKVQLNSKSFYFYYLLIPAYLTLISMTVLVNSYLLLKEVFDNAHKMAKEEKTEGCSLGTILSLICLNMTCVCVLLYLTMLAIKLENNEYLINLTFNLISIPVYISMGVAVFFFIFILPAFIFHGFYFPIIVLCAYIISFIISFLMLNLKLDSTGGGSSYVSVATPMMIAVSIHLLYFITRLTFEKDETNKGIFVNIVKFFGMAGILASLALLALRADGKSVIPSCIPVIAFGACFMLAADYFWVNEDEEE